MTRNKYPAECPVFEVVTRQWIPDVRPGQIFEGALFVGWGDKIGNVPFPIVDPEGSAWLPSELRPLTRAARQMLALVKR